VTKFDEIKLYLRFFEWEYLRHYFSARDKQFSWTIQTFLRKMLIQNKNRFKPLWFKAIVQPMEQRAPSCSYVWSSRDRGRR